MDYRVPMHEQPVVMALVEAEPAEYSIYLAPFTDRREGPERVDDYLNGSRRFLPMLHDGAAKIVNRDQILWMEVDLFVSLAEGDEVTVIQKLAILEMIDGTRLEGFLDMNRPPDRQRLSDVLNDEAERFVRLTTDTKTYFVNKNYVRIAVPR